MKLNLLTLSLVFLTTANVWAADDAQLLQQLKQARFSLVDAINNAEKTSGPAISAKFEMDGNDLVFSVYTAPQGLMVSAEETELMELSGSAVSLPVTAKTEIFTDKEHIARASTHLTLMELSTLTLKQVIELAQSYQSGIVFSVKNPLVRNHRAVADVSILKVDGKVAVVSIDLLSSHCYFIGSKTN